MDKLKKSKKHFAQKYALISIIIFLLFAWFLLYAITSWKGSKTISPKNTKTISLLNYYNKEKNSTLAFFVR